MDKKKTISVNLTDVSPGDFEGTLVDLRGKINDWIDLYGPTARLDWDPHFYYDYDPNPSPRFNIIGWREETDKELAIRLEKDEEMKTLTDRRDEAEFERLQKKFGFR
jgi:hypothetical protein